MRLHKENPLYPQEFEAYQILSTDDPQNTVNQQIDARCVLKLSRALDKALEERDEARSESLDQARLNGIGAQRELRLMAQVKELKRVISKVENVSSQGSDHNGNYCDEIYEMVRSIIG